MSPLDTYLEVRKKILQGLTIFIVSIKEKLATSETKGVDFFNCKRKFLSDTTCAINFQVTELCSELGITVCDLQVAKSDDALSRFFRFLPL